MHSNASRQLPVGAEPRDGGVHFRVWARDHAQVHVVPDHGAAYDLDREADGYFSAFVPHAHAGSRYRFRVGDALLPDPASRYQPEGPHGPSEVVDPSTFVWSDAAWPGVADVRHVVYELHVGTFTREGTWRAAAGQLSYLADLGVSVIELMPIAEFPGRFNWGYDGVDPFAPAHVYGTPDEMRAFIDRAHAHGIGVILDVVYNHMGPSGCYLREFADAYFSTRYSTEWGDALNLDGKDSAPVREFVLANVEYWIREFHMDGFRVDATQSIFDAGTPHILTELTARARAAAGGRRVWLVAENEPQDRRIFEEFGFDAAWNDDFHHSAMVALTGRAEGYYTDYTGSAQELISSVKWGYLFQGQYYHWQKKRRGTGPLGISARHFVHYIQNHDQIANSATAARVHELSSPGELRAMTALLHLMPQHVLLFQGQEFNASSPFTFFADHEPDLARKVHTGRREFLAQFPSAALPEVQRAVPDPAAAPTFEQCKLDHEERQEHEEMVRMHRDLIRLVRNDAVLAAADSGTPHGAVLGPRTFVLRWVRDVTNDRLVIVNLGDDLTLERLGEPLLGLPEPLEWQLLWSSEEHAYGGTGATSVWQQDALQIPGRCAVVLQPARGVARGA